MVRHLHITARLSTTTFLLYNASRLNTSEAEYTGMSSGDQAVRLHAADDGAEPCNNDQREGNSYTLERLSVEKPDVPGLLLSGT